MKVTVLAGGVGGARFLKGLRTELRRAYPNGDGGSTAEITAVVNTGDDMWLTGLRVCPDLDSIMYALGGGNDEQRGWGRAGETERVSAELSAYGIGWPWFTLGDLDIGTHIARSSFLRDGLTLTEATARLCERWNPGVRLLPMSDQPVETHVEFMLDGKRHIVHFEEWWVKHRAAVPAKRFIQVGVEAAHPTPQVLSAIAHADVVLLAPSNPVVSIGTILGVPGMREALRATRAPIVGVSPIISGAAVRGYADACLTAIGVETSAVAVAKHYGARPRGGLLDGWLVDEADAVAVPVLEASGLPTRAVPLWMRDADTSAQLAADALALARVPR
ncbi:2-phospho-L-lactate transferase [Herbiconiux moechotypicola]|uniref:2-phospho-L-lactate transferase n=1 Tax=Herbiconiux moechotypicola TaxID=637393 RepID=UPI00217E86C0|nr:2-phospho-L-lactate transferase [Herbiconiux moechotypicola]MCS5731950.1 2-phospho-L-lactate transferase [Herbiconiux moechotypicola]